MIGTSCKIPYSLSQFEVFPSEIRPHSNGSLHMQKWHCVGRATCPFNPKLVLNPLFGHSQLVLQYFVAFFPLRFGENILSLSLSPYLFTVNCSRQNVLNCPIRNQPEHSNETKRSAHRRMDYIYK